MSFLYANYIGRMSTYYYFKTYYLFWMITFYMLVLDIAECEKEKRDMVNVYCASVLLLFAFIFSGLESCLEEKSEANGKNLNWELQAKMVFRIYSWNLEFGSKDNMSISAEREELYQKVAELSGNPNQKVPYIGPYDFDNYAYYALAYQWEDLSYRWMDSESLINGVLAQSEYICLVYDERTSIDETLSSYLETLKVTFSNEAGCVYVVE